MGCSCHQGQLRHDQILNKYTKCILCFIFPFLNSYLVFFHAGQTGVWLNLLQGEFYEQELDLVMNSAWQKGAFLQSYKGSFLPRALYHQIKFLLIKLALEQMKSDRCHSSTLIHTKIRCYLNLPHIQVQMVSYMLFSVLEQLLCPLFVPNSNCHTASSLKFCNRFFLIQIRHKTHECDKNL